MAIRNRKIETLFIQEKLIQEKLISAKQLPEIYTWQKDANVSFIKALLDLKLMDEQRMASFMAKTFKWPVISIENYQIDKSIATLLPPELLTSHNFIPIEKIEQITCAAISQPLEEDEISEIENLLHTQLQFFIDVYSKIETAVNRIVS